MHWQMLTMLLCCQAIITWHKPSATSPTSSRYCWAAGRPPLSINERAASSSGCMPAACRSESSSSSTAQSDSKHSGLRASPGALLRLLAPTAPSWLPMPAKQVMAADDAGTLNVTYSLLLLQACSRRLMPVPILWVWAASATQACGTTASVGCSGCTIAEGGNTCSCCKFGKAVLEVAVRHAGCNCFRCGRDVGSAN